MYGVDIINLSFDMPRDYRIQIRKRQSGNSAEVIAYADKANERLRRKYYKMTLGRGVNGNIAKTAIARELACFIWGMMTEHIG